MGCASAAMKIVSPQILHKTDVGGVRLGLRGAEDVARAFMEITSSVRRLAPSAWIAGVSIQEMVTGGRELIVGMSRDPQFGPLLMFGLGGIYVEVLKDVSFRVVPVSRRDAGEMVREIRAWPLLAASCSWTGSRGRNRWTRSCRRPTPSGRGFSAWSSIVSSRRRIRSSGKR
jgi:acetyltransferase